MTTIQFARRVAAMSAKALLVFLLAYGVGAIAAFLINQYLLVPYNSFGLGSILGIMLWTGTSITSGFVIINGAVTYAILVPLNRRFHTPDE